MKTVIKVAAIKKELSEDHRGWVKHIFDPDPVHLDGERHYCFKKITATGNTFPMWGYGRGLLTEDELRTEVTNISDIDDLFHFSRYGLCARCGSHLTN